jgi:hypothetical protein
MHPFPSLMSLLCSEYISSLPQLELLNLGIAQQYTCYRKPNLSTLSSILENTSLPPIRSLADVFSFEQACRKAKAPQKTGERQIEYRANIKHFDPQSPLFVVHPMKCHIANADEVADALFVDECRKGSVMQ